MSTYYNENAPKTAAWLQGLMSRGLVPDGHLDTRSIVDVRPDDVRGFCQAHWFAGIGGWPEALRLAGWPVTSPVWTASLPCQPWSNSGRGLGEEDARHLAPTFLSLTEVCRPPVIFGEQVASEDALRWLDELFFRLETQGYACAAADLCAAGIGAIHGRQRLFWVAYADSAGVPRLEPPGDSGAHGQGWMCGEEDMHAVISSPFASGPRWPQPLIRAEDDGLCRKRVAGCHGAGNAIIPQVAAEFVSAFMDTLTA